MELSLESIETLRSKDIEKHIVVVNEVDNIFSTQKWLNR